MVTINRYEAQDCITNILAEFLNKLKDADANKKQLAPETIKLFSEIKNLAALLKNNVLCKNFYPLLSLDGIKQLYNGCIELARCYELSSYRKYKDACIEYRNIFKIGSSLNSFVAKDSTLKVEEGRCVVFKLEQLNDYVLESGGNIYYSVEWRKTDTSGKDKSGIINNLIKNNLDDNIRDREFSFDEIGKYKIHADYVQRLYGRSEYRKVIEHNEITVLVVPGDEKVKNMKLQDKYIYAIRYADWDEAICDAKTMAAMLIVTTVLFGIIALTPIDELMAIMAPIFQAIGIGGAIEEVVKSLYLIGDFIKRVNKAQSEEALEEAGDIFAQIIVTLGIAGLSALLSHLSGKLGAKVKERLKARQQNSKKTAEFVIGQRANELVEAPEGYELVHYKDVDGITQTNIRRKDSTVGEFLFVDENGYVQNARDVKQWKRENTVGATPGKDSKTGRAVIKRMEGEGKIKELPNGKKYVYSEKAKRWIKFEDCDMSHIKAAVVYWNEEGKYYGPLSPEVRKWMLESQNYYLEYYVINRSEGGKINMSYQAPVFNLEY